MKNPLVEILENLKKEGIFPTDNEIKKAIETLKLISIKEDGDTAISTYARDLRSGIRRKKIDEKTLETNIPNQIKNQLKSTNQIKTNPVKSYSKDNQNDNIEITSFQDLIVQANKEKEIELKYDLERNVKLVSFNRGKIDISFNEKLNKNFIKNLTEKLLLWTGERWIISLSKNADAKSIYEINQEDKSNKIEEFKKSKIAQDIQKAFPDAKLIDLKEEE